MSLLFSLFASGMERVLGAVVGRKATQMASSLFNQGLVMLIQRLHICKFIE